MRYHVIATQPVPDQPGTSWIEAEEDTASLEAALHVIRRWVENSEIEPYGHGPVSFTVRTTPIGSEFEWEPAVIITPGPRA